MKGALLATVAPFLCKAKPKGKTEQMKNLDIDTVAACEAGAEIEFKNPVNGKPSGIFYTTVGKDSKTWRGIVNQASDAERNRQHQAEKRGKTAEPKPQAQIDADASQMLAEGALGWRYETVEGEGANKKVVNHPGVVPFNGGELAFSVENVAKFFNERPDYKRQADEGVADLSNFIKG